MHLYRNRFSVLPTVKHIKTEFDVSVKQNSFEGKKGDTLLQPVST